jgi:hypothetical protein
MRLQLVAVAGLLAAPALAFDTVVSSKVQVYADTDATVVVSPHVSATGTFTSTKTSLNASYTEDVVSSASVDVRTTASPRIYDRRQEVDVGVGQEVAGLTLGGSFMHARERDYLSNGGSLTLSRDLFQRNTTLGLRVGYMSNVVGRADDPLYQAPMTDLSGDLVLTQVFSPTLLGQLNATVGQSNGMIASPYRKVAIYSGAAVAEVVPENEPPSRFKFAAAVGLKKYIGVFVAHLDYRLYTDTWQLLSHTVDARWIIDLSPVTIRLRYRFYTQNSAYFYQQRYDALRLYVSSDREVSRFMSHLFGLKIEWTPLRTARGAAFRFDAKVEGMYFRYFEFDRLPQRWALISQAGFEVDF